MEVTELLVSKNSKDIYTLNNLKNAVIEIAGRDSQSGQTSEKAVSTRIKEDPKFKNSLKNNAILFFNKLKMNYHIAQCLSNVENIPNIRSQSILTSGIGIVIASRDCILYF